MLRRLRSIFQREVWAAEFWSATTALIWSVLLILPWRQAGPWPSLRLLDGLVGEHGIELIGFGLGVGQLLFLLYDVRWLRWAAALVMGWFWGAVAVSAGVGVPDDPIAAAYAGWVAINVYSSLRLLRPGG